MTYQKTRDASSESSSSLRQSAKRLLLACLVGLLALLLSSIARGCGTQLSAQQVSPTTGTSTPSATTVVNPDLIFFGGFDPRSLTMSGISCHVGSACLSYEITTGFGPQPTRINTETIPVSTGRKAEHGIAATPLPRSSSLESTWVRVVPATLGPNSSVRPTWSASNASYTTSSIPTNIWYPMPSVEPSTTSGVGSLRYWVTIDAPVYAPPLGSSPNPSPTTKAVGFQPIGPFTVDPGTRN